MALVMGTDATAGTWTGFSAVLKEFYGPRIEKVLNQKTVLFDALSEAGAECKIAGKRLVFPVHSEWSGGVGSIAENSTLPTAGNQGYVQGTVTAEELYGRIQVTNKVMQASKGNDASFLSAIESETRGITKEIQQSLNRQLYGQRLSNMTTGLVAQINGAMSTVTQFTVDTTHHLHTGMKLRLAEAVADLGGGASVTAVDVATDADLTHANNDDNWVPLVISTIDSRTQFTVAAADIGVSASVTASCADNSFLCVGDDNFTAVSGSTGFEILGLEHIVHDSTTAAVNDLHGIEPDKDPTWTSHRDDNSGTNRNLSHEMMDAMFDGVTEKGGETPDFVVGHLSFAREVKKLMEGDVRYEPLTFKGGFRRRALTWNNGETDVPILSDRHCLPNRAFFLNLEYLKIGYLQKFRWLDDDGAVLSRVSGKANFEATYGAILNLVCTKRNAHGKLEDISVNTDHLIVPS